jgi:hypothetical protein
MLFRLIRIIEDYAEGIATAPFDSANKDYLAIARPPSRRFERSTGSRVHAFGNRFAFVAAEEHSYAYAEFEVAAIRGICATERRSGLGSAGKTLVDPVARTLKE